MQECRLYVKVADTPEQQAQGLMFVKSMPEDEGMLFSFSRTQRLNFWGENTFIPLDIAFVDKNGIIRKISKISPFSKRPVECSSPCKYAVEANDGFFENNRISVGDKIHINREEEDHFITFVSNGRNFLQTKGNAKARQILAQLMSDEVAYDMREAPPEEEERNIPKIRSEDLGQFLEDNLEDEPIEIPEEELGAMEAPLEDPEVEEPQDYPQFSNAFDAQEWAKDNNEVVRIAYTTEHGTGIVRDVEPHGTFHADTTGHEILVTYDRSVGDIRAFILKNIATFSFIGERFDPKFEVV